MTIPTFKTNVLLFRRTLDMIKGLPFSHIFSCALPTKKCSLPPQPWRQPYHILIPTLRKNLHNTVKQSDYVFYHLKHKSYFLKYTYVYVYTHTHVHTHIHTQRKRKFICAINIILNFLTRYAFLLPA